MGALSHFVNVSGAIHDAFRKAELADQPPGAFEQMAEYIELLTKWNGRLNLTAIRTPEEMIRRHLVECAILSKWLPEDVETVMDYGSGAGLPGVVVSICRPRVRVTLAEAHGKKVSFLREVNRSLDLKCEVYEGRVETMQRERLFDAVTMRAVEKMEFAIPIALGHVRRYLVILTTEALADGYRSQVPDVAWGPDLRIENSEQMVIASAVPRGTR